MVWVNMVFAENFGWVRFLVVCFLYKTIPNPRKPFAVGKKVAQLPLLTYFSWAGLALGWGVQRFHNNIHIVSDPTEFGKSQTP